MMNEKVLKEQILEEKEQIEWEDKIEEYILSKSPEELKKELKNTLKEELKIHFPDLSGTLYEFGISITGMDIIYDKKCNTCSKVIKSGLDGEKEECLITVKLAPDNLKILDLRILCAECSKNENIKVLIKEKSAIRTEVLLHFHKWELDNQAQDLRGITLH